MELAKFLQERNVDAHLLHLQEIRNKEDWPNARPQWIKAKPKDWSHYVVRVGDVVIDVTSRQLDPSNPHPNVMTLENLKKLWKTVETDNFLEKIVQELVA